MSRIMFKVLALSALVTHGTIALEDGVLLSETFGGPHGTKYSDLDFASAGQTVQAITIRAGERVNGVGIDVTDPTGLKSTLYHGGGGGKPNMLMLDAGEYITGVEAHWGEKGDHTRIKFIRFTTSVGNTISEETPRRIPGKTRRLRDTSWVASLALVAKSWTRWAPFGPALSSWRRLEYRRLLIVSWGEVCPTLVKVADV